MSLVLIEAPEVEPVLLEDVKGHLAVDSNDFDSLLHSYIVAVRQHLDGATGILRRAIVRQTWELRLRAFPDVLELPLPPLQSITSISFVDTNGETQTISPSAYQVGGIGGAQPGCIVPAFGTQWPAARDVPESVKIRFVCGYPGDGGSPEDLRANIPGPLRQAIMELVADLWANRENVSADQSFAVPMPANAKALLAPFRVWSFA